MTLTDLEIIEVKAKPKPGASLDRTKQEAIAVAKTYKCWVTFKHNVTSYIADDEGNIAKIQ